MITIVPPAKRLKLKVSFPTITDKTAVTTAENGMIIATVVGLICFKEFVLIIQHKPLPITIYNIVKIICSGLKEKCIFSIGTRLPDDIYYLNWDYATNPRVENIEKLAQTGKKQIVCPGISNWSRFCENVEVEETNISLMAEYGYKHGAVGVLNTSWGDFANPASIELSMYGIVLGAAKSWAVETKIDDEFYGAVNALVYGDTNAISYLKRISAAHTNISKNWNLICSKYFEVKHGRDMTLNTPLDMSGLPAAQKETLAVIRELGEQKWKNDEYREEMLLCAESIYVLAQIAAKLFGGEAETAVSMCEWMKKYKKMWLLKNKESEISKIEEMVLYVANNL